MSPNPDSFLHHLRSSGYHSRSNKHSNALAEAIVQDLLDTCPAMSEMAREARLVHELNFTINAGTSDWNIDLVLGAPPPGTIAPPEGTAIVRTRPSTVQVAVEIKSIMTEHQKAMRNRKRDLEAHHEHVHRYRNQAVAGGVFVVNQAATFKSPLRAVVSQHAKPKALVEKCVQQMRGISSRAGLQGAGLECKAVIVVDMDNQDLASTRYVHRPPAPQVGDPLHYDAFIQSLCAFYTQRFA
ncbi:MAG: hypothetical protein R6X20_06195 [Phycisphaerae bacterium]